MAESEVISPSFPKVMGKTRINLREIVTRCFRVEIENRHLRTMKMKSTCSNTLQLLGGSRKLYAPPKRRSTAFKGHHVQEQFLDLLPSNMKALRSFKTSRRSNNSWTS